MGRAKEQYIEREERGNHLDRCMKCNAVLRTYEEREIAICDACYKRALEKE
ncbi:hypothetical protein ACJROX_10865 [Pseudalkalibacillus sp. A8]|uniref:hypothetical protein n=1 Tax=Pseudalkalibacillus sp. A8 TaxID=3382641 RepID=UPI0038B4CEC6